MRAGPVGDLPHARRTLVDGFGELVVVEPEHLAQHEDRPLGGSQRLEDEHHRHRHAVGELDVLGDVAGGDERLGEPRTDVVLAAAGHRAQPVERGPAHDAHEEGARVTHLALVHRVPLEPRVLDDVLGVGRGPEHLVGHGEEQAAVSGERVTGPGLRGVHAHETEGTFGTAFEGADRGASPHASANSSEPIPSAMLPRAL